MDRYQNASITYPISIGPLFDAILRATISTLKRILDRREAARYARTVSELSPHLRYDIGELDCMPPAPLPLRETQRRRQQLLEPMWPLNPPNAGP